MEYVCTYVRIGRRVSVVKLVQIWQEVSLYNVAFCEVMNRI